MDIVELKAKIESNNISNKPLIFKYSENKYLAYQYAQEIARKRNLEIMYVESVADIPRDSLMFDSDPFYLYICDVDKFSENISNDDIDVIIICNKVADNLKVDYIDFPKTLPWQIEDFIKMRLAGLDALQIKWLCDISKYDIYRLDNECKKLEIFTVAEQKIIFDLINNDNGFSDLNTLTIFNFTNAILKKDLSTIQAVLTDLKNIDIEGSGLITIFHKQFKNIIDIDSKGYIISSDGVHTTKDKIYKAVTDIKTNEDIKIYICNNLSEVVNKAYEMYMLNILYCI